MTDQQIEREIWIRENEEKIRRLFPWWFQPIARRLAGYRRRDITDGHIWKS
jgi:hypothetical protein